LVHRCADLALESSDGLLSVNEDILDFSKPEAGCFEPEAIDFNGARRLQGVLASSQKSDG
jgi:hypothetical protein